MRATLAKLLFCLSLGLEASAAQAQIAVDPVQQCVWRCLSEAGGNASSAAYNICVQRRCTGQVAGRAWVASRLDPRDPPYLDGFSVNAVTADTGLRVFYVCGFEEDSYISFESPALTRRYNLNAISPGNMRLIVFVDEARRYLIDASRFEGTLTGAVHPESPLFADLATARSATVWAEDRYMLGTLPLGNIEALQKAGAACVGR